MDIIQRALGFLRDNTCIGLGSGRTARAFVRALGEAIQTGSIRVQGVPTSEETAAFATEVGVPLVPLEQTGTLEVTVDGADEVDPKLNLIKGYGRALVREKIVAASSKTLVILVGKEKLVPRLGTRGKLPVEVLPFGLPLCQKRLTELGRRATPFCQSGALFLSDNGNCIVDVEISPRDDLLQLEQAIKAIPGVVDTGLFLGMADIVLVGAGENFELIEERHVKKENNRRP